MPSSSGRCFQVRDEGARTISLCERLVRQETISQKSEALVTNANLPETARVEKRRRRVFVNNPVGEAIFFRHTKRKFHVLRLHADHGEVESRLWAKAMSPLTPFQFGSVGDKGELATAICRAPRTVSSLIKVKCSRSDAIGTRMIRVVSPSGRQ